MGKQSRRTRELVPAPVLAEMPVEAKAIVKILTKQLKCDGFIRFVDGDTSNCNINNLARCSATDAFTRLDWKVDWDCHLSSEQRDFVHLNIAKFAKIFS